MNELYEMIEKKMESICYCLNLMRKLFLNIILQSEMKILILVF